jgi:hypothetical protein
MTAAIRLTEAITRLEMNQVPGTSIGKVEVFKCNQARGRKHHLYKVTVIPEYGELSIKVEETRGYDDLSLAYFRTPSGAVEYLHNMLRGSMWTFEE